MSGNRECDFSPTEHRARLLVGVSALSSPTADGQLTNRAGGQQISLLRMEEAVEQHVMIQGSREKGQVTSRVF